MLLALESAGGEVLEDAGGVSETGGIALGAGAAVVDSLGLQPHNNGKPIAHPVISAPRNIVRRCVWAFTWITSS